MTFMIFIHFQNDTCLIEGKCYGTNDADPNNSCNICIPDKAGEQWSLIQGNHKVTNIIRYAYNVEEIH